jgi:hypothetical protein
LNGGHGRMGLPLPGGAALTPMEAAGRIVRGCL